jgi:hypothetical protein
MLAHQGAAEGIAAQAARTAGGEGRGQGRGGATGRGQEQNSVNEGVWNEDRANLLTLRNIP